MEKILAQVQPLTLLLSKSRRQLIELKLKIEVLKISKATPMKTRCFDSGQEFSLLAMSCSMTCTSTPPKQTVRPEEWLNSLQKIRELNLRLLFLDMARLELSLTRVGLDLRKTIICFEEELKKAKDADSLINTMKENSHPPTCSWQSNGREG